MNTIRQNCFVSIATALAFGLHFASAPNLQADEIEVKSVLLRLIEQVDVPAQEAGVLTAIDVREGDIVTPGQVLARIDDRNIMLQKERAELELQISAKAEQNQTDVIEATEELNVAKQNYARGKESRDTLRKSISDAELSQLHLVEVHAQAKLNRATHELQVAALTQQLKEKDLATMEHALARRQIKTPIGGMVVEVLKHQGEWVEPGEKVIRVVQLDRLRAEGFVPAKFATRSLIGKSVVVTLDEQQSRTYQGRIVFVNPEIDPVNRQARVWAEVENPNHELSPGLRAKMVINPRSLRERLSFFAPRKERSAFHDVCSANIERQR